mgnify:CR=1 FL=1
MEVGGGGVRLAGAAVEVRVGVLPSMMVATGDLVGEGCCRVAVAAMAGVGVGSGVCEAVGVGLGRAVGKRRGAWVGVGSRVSVALRIAGAEVGVIPTTVVALGRTTLEP